MNEPLARITELVAAMAEAHTERALDRVIRATFERWNPGAGASALDADPELARAVRVVVDAARRKLEVVRRVADLSRRAHVEGKELRADLERLSATARPVARSQAMRDVLARVALVARHPTTVLVTGESGTGKEVVARELHRLSPRAHRPMVQVNCAAIPEALVESELFGHERGAFTGAERVHAGVFERADGGTLLLDEIGDLPLAAQAKLLRVLQEQQVRRVGGTVVRPVDVRLVAATNRSLEALVHEGRFRDDLRFRIDVFAIHLPPLRERKEDLAPLVAAILSDLAARLRIEPPRVTRAVMERLERHDWPGNVRELANVLEAAAILGTDGVLALPADFAPATDAPKRHRPFDTSVRQVIENALRATRGKIYGAGGAAERLGLKPGTLQSKMKKLGIERARFV